MKKLWIVIALTALWAMLGSSANAQCGFSPERRQALVLPALHSLNIDLKPIPHLPDNGEGPEATIVGLWDVTFTAGNQLYDEGFDQYHSDGTEIMNDIPPPATGNVCLGVWARTGHRTYKLKHPFWIFDSNGNLIGRGLLTEQISLDADGESYSGTANFQFRDLNGDTIPSMPDVTATMQATRIGVD